MAKDLDEIRKLSPEERIKRLRKLEEEKRKELEEAKKLIDESAVELEREEKIKKETPVPQMKAVDMGQLFTQEEKQVFATKRYKEKELKEPEDEKPPAKPEEKTLEDEVWKEQLNLSEEQLEQQRQYGEQLASEPASELYQAARDAYDDFRETGAVDPATVYRLDVAIREKDASSGGEYRASSERMQEQFGSAKSIVKYLRGF